MVPSCEDKVSPFINKSVSDLYVFTRALDNGGHSFMMLFRVVERVKSIRGDHQECFGGWVAENGSCCMDSCLAPTCVACTMLL